MIEIDMWYGDSHKEADYIDVTFYPNGAEYRGNMYRDGKIIGDYVCNDSVRALMKGRFLFFIIL